MSRTCIPFSTGDISSFARSLRNQLARADGAPGQLELLNMLARAAGYRNYQSLRAQSLARDRFETPAPAPPDADFTQVQSAARHFDPHGRLATWPAKPALRAACLWVPWSKLPAAQSLTEDELNRIIRAAHLFGDHALLRRELCDAGLIARTRDGREYRRVERPPSPEGLALIRRFGGGK
jgi:hypothetical protein